jgi:Caspase domain
MTHRLLRTLLVLAYLTYLCPLAVHAQAAEDRVAFIIGNGGYPKSLALKNPLNDAAAIEKQLASLGFETKSYKDLKVAEVSGLRQQMESRLNRNSVLFFYYAGHGVQIDGRNYLLPVDATLNDGDKASKESLYLGDVLHAIERMRPKIAVMILDACRDNPFKDQKNSPAAKQGLARVDPPTSTVVFYATRPGGTAQDGDDENGVFTKALLQEMVKPEQPLEVVFRRVSTSVFKSTKSEQEPWIEGVIREEFFVNQGVIQKPLQPIAVAVAIPQVEKEPALPPVKTPEHPTEVLVSALPPSNSKPTPSQLEVAAGNDEKLVIKSLDKVEALRRLNESIQKKELSNKLSFYCDGNDCFEYAEWVKSLASLENLDSIKSGWKGIKFFYS